MFTVKEKPRCCAYFRGDKCIEGFIEHIEASLSVWRELKPYYYKSVLRSMSLRSPSIDFVELALVLHDFGKLAGEYQVHRRSVVFRHEVLSGYVAFKVLESLSGIEGDIRYIVSMAVMLHHEPIILSAYATRLGEKHLTISNLRKVIELSDLTLSCELDLEYFNKFNYGRTIAGFIEKWDNEGLDPDDIVNVLRDLIIKATIGDLKRLHIIRAKVASILHLIVVSDSIAAHIKRCDGGTWVSRRALEGAEALDRERLAKVAGGCRGRGD